MDSTIPDEILIKNFDDIASMVPLTAKQVGMILGRSQDQLEDDRAGGRPPPFYKLGRSVRYPIGPLRDHLRQSLASSNREVRARAEEEYLMASPPRRGRPPKGRLTTFQAFLTTGAPIDTWPFLLMGPFKRPVEFFLSLTLEASDDDEPVMLFLGDYLARLSKAAGEEDASEQATALQERCDADPKARAESAGIGEGCKAIHTKPSPRF